MRVVLQALSTSTWLCHQTAPLESPPTPPVEDEVAAQVDAYTAFLSVLGVQVSPAATILDAYAKKWKGKDEPDAAGTGGQEVVKTRSRPLRLRRLL